VGIKAIAGSVTANLCGAWSVREIKETETN